MAVAATWQPVDPQRARSLSDARLQVHHAAQLATAMGISFLPRERDDSHTNLGWDARGILVSRAVPAAPSAVSIGVRVADLSLLIMQAGEAIDVIPLDRRSVADVASHVRQVLARSGIAADRFTLDRHYTLPHHRVANGEPFDASDRQAFVEISRWFGNASMELERVARVVDGASEVRVWPHYFDIATLVTLPGGGSTGAGLEPGDQYYDEPYFYVNAHPAPDAAQLTASLEGNGRWHTREWTGAVLPGSYLAGDAAAQQHQARAFLDSALAACRALVTQT